MRYTEIVLLRVGDRPALTRLLRFTSGYDVQVAVGAPEVDGSTLFAAVAGVD